MTALTFRHQYKSGEEEQSNQRVQKLTPRRKNLKMHVENMNEGQLQQAMETIAEDPNNVTIIDNNGNENNYNIKTEMIEPENNNVHVRRSTRIKSYN